MIKKLLKYTYLTLLFISVNTYLHGFSIDSTNKIITRAKEISSFIEKNGRYITNLASGTPYSFPVGLKQNIGGRDYVISIDSITINAQGAFLTAYMVFPVGGKNSTEELIFMGTNIPISKNGGIDGTVRLDLIKNFDVSFGETTLRFLADNRLTFAEWDCGGFVQMGIDAEAIFSKDWFLKENLDGSISDDLVKGKFTTIINDWSDLMVSISIDPFQIKGLKDFSFQVNQATFDYSDINNPININFPSNYANNLPTGMESLWRGFHLQQLKVKLPPSFNTKSNTRSEVIAQNLIIDKYGFTGIVGGNNIFTLNQGNLNGWEYSLDSLRLAIVLNKLTGGRFAGQMKLPIMEQNTSLAYSGYIAEDDGLGFLIQSLDTIQSTLWKAKLALIQRSRVDVSYDNGIFKPKANLNGSLSLDLKVNETNPTDNSSLKFSDIKFQGLVLQTEKPYVSLESASTSLSQSSNLSKYPVSLDSIALSVIEDELKLDIGIRLNLSGANNNTNGFGAKGLVSIYSEFSDENNIHNIKYNKLEIGSLAVNVDQGSFSLKGSINKFNSDPLYGNGFKGQLQAQFRIGDKNGIDVQAQALFGNIDGYRYWNADALATFSPAINVLPGFKINGFGGGAYYHMKQVNGNHPLGMSISGVNYTPDGNTGLGIKAMVGFQGTESEAYNGNLTLEFAFNNGGGLNNISLYGNADFMTPPFVNSQSALASKTANLVNLNDNFVGNITTSIINNKLNDYNSKIESFQTQGKVSAKAFVQYDFSNKTLHATFDTYVKLAGGLIKGTGSNYLAGNATMHFAPSSWYIHIGKPTNRIGLRFLDLLNTGSYFMIGDSIPPLPPIPTYVNNITGNTRSSNNLGDMSLGKGFAIGSEFHLASSGSVSIFNYSLNAGLGFDVLVKKRPGVLCSNTNSLIGVNGWYAEAQTWAYLSGNVGVKIKRRTFNILSLAAAATLEAKLPNPSWFNGTVAGQYSVLGGLKKGSFDLDVTFGKTCSIRTQAITQDSVDVKIISKIETDKSSNSNETSTLSTIKTHLNVEAGKEEQMELLINSIVETYDYKIDLIKYEVKEKNTSTLVQGSVKWDTTHKIATFKPSLILKPSTNYDVYVKVKFFKKTGNNWQPLILDGNTITEEKTFNFITNGGEDRIIKENIAYSYPIENQSNFYIKEHSQGFIKLKQTQGSLFIKDTLFSSSTGVSSIANRNVSTSKTSEFKVKWTTNNGDVYYANDLVYDSQSNQINFSIPQNLPQNKVLHIDLLKILETDTVSLYDFYARTSNYESLSQKMQALQYSNGWTYPVDNLVHEVGITLSGNELFDKVELKGDVNNSIAPLISIETQLDSIEWYKQAVYPHIYQNYPYNGIALTNRNTSTLGVPPVKASFVRYSNSYTLSKSNLKNNQIPSNNANSAIVMNTAKIASDDYLDLRNQISNLYAYSSSQVTPAMANLLNTSFTQISPGDYYLNVIYKLPNGVVTTNYSLKINVPF